MSDIDSNKENAIDHLTESRDVLGDVAAELRTENADLRVEVKRLNAILKSVTIVLSGKPSNGADAIRKERFRHLMEEGFDSKHDDKHRAGELALAAACYAIPPEYRDALDRACENENTHNGLPLLYPKKWASRWWKPSPSNRKRELEKSGALIAAEWDLLDRLEKAGGAS